MNRTKRVPSPQVPCRHCDGHGHVLLAQPYARTYRWTSRTWEATEKLLARHTDGVALTALHQRLGRLVGLGLIERRRDSNTVEWRRK
jgi:hypothetical protein